MPACSFLHRVAFFLLGVSDEKKKEIITALRHHINNENAEEIILSILNGEKYVRDDIHEYFCNYWSAREKFFQIYKCTEHEIELGKILVLAKQGLPQKKIASELGLTATQVHTRCKRYGIATIGIINKRLAEMRRQHAEHTS